MNDILNLKYFAGGQWIESKTYKYMEVHNASTGEIIAKTPCCTSDEVKYSIECASKAFPGWRDTPVLKRVQV